MKNVRFAATVAAMLISARGYAVTLNPVADTWVQNATTADNSASDQLRVKNQNNQVNDRVSFLKFDGSSITQPVDVARLSVTVGAFSSPTNMTIQLFGIPDGGANEDFDAATLTFANSGYTDQSVDNNVNDALFEGGMPLATAALLGSNPVGTELTFSSPSLTNFVNANTVSSQLSFVLSTSTIADSVFLAFRSVENISGTPPVLSAFQFVTDFDGMNGTDIADFHILRSNYLNTGATNPQGDANFDSVVNHEDFFLWRTDFLAGGGSAADITWAVPEPSSCMMLLGGCMAAACTLRVRRRK